MMTYAEPTGYSPTIDDVKSMYDNRRWSTTSLGISGSGNNKLVAPTRNTLSMKHNSSWVYGYNDFDINIINPLQANYIFYGNYRPSLSLIRSSGTYANKYPMLDLALASQFSWTELNERVFDLGFDLHLAPPNTWHYLVIGAYARKNFNYTGGTYSIQLRGKVTIARSVIFKLTVDGTPKDQNPKPSQNQIALKANLMVRADLLLDVGRAWGRGDQVYLGPTFRYWANKLGRKGINESSYGIELLISL